MAKYKFTVCGGTFDLFHKGHEKLLEKAFGVSDKVLIGITSESYVRSFKNNLVVENYSKRKNAVKNFLKQRKLTKKTLIVPINSAYEPYLETSDKYDSIVVSKQTKKVAIDINRKRKKKKLNPLDIIVSPNVLAQDKKIISSTRVRNGKISRNGKLYIDSRWKSKKLLLPEKLRSNFQKPWGKIVKDVPLNLEPSKTVVVGDYATKIFNLKKVNQLLSIVDFKIQREEKFNNVSQLGFGNEHIFTVKNTAGTISWKLFTGISKALKSKYREIILVDGEDDLAVLPVLLLAPLGFMVFYGQPGVGMVQLEVSENMKENAFLLAEKFNLKTV